MATKDVHVKTRVSQDILKLLKEYPELRLEDKKGKVKENYKLHLFKRGWVSFCSVPQMHIYVLIKPFECMYQAFKFKHKVYD